MTILITILSSGERTWNHVASLIATKKFEKTILITNENGVKSFPAKFPKFNTEETKYEFMIVDFEKPAQVLIKDMLMQLSEQHLGFEIAVNFVSGSGKEHMSFLAALLKLGIAFRPVAMTKEGLTEL